MNQSLNNGQSKKYQPVLLIFLISSVILLSASSCGCTTTKYVDRPVVVYSTPPSTLLETEPIPMFNGRYNKDLVAYIIELKQLCLELNAKISGIKSWCDTVNKNNGQKQVKFNE